MLSDADSRAAVDRRLMQRPQAPPASRYSPAPEPAVRGDDDEFDLGHDDFDGDDRPLTGGHLPAWMRLGSPLAFVVGIFAVIFGVLAGGFVLVRFGILLLGLSALLFLLSPFVVLVRSRGGPMR